MSDIGWYLLTAPGGLRVLSVHSSGCVFTVDVNTAEGVRHVHLRTFIGIYPYIEWFRRGERVGVTNKEIAGESCEG